MASDSKVLIEKLQNGPDEILQSSLNELIYSASSDELFKVHLQYLPLIVTTLQNRTKYSEESLNLVQSFLVSVALLLPSQINSSKYLEAFRDLVELDRPLYTSFAQDTRTGSWDPCITEDGSWKTSLTEGDRVDCVKVDQKYDCKCWAAAFIEKIDQEDLLHIHFEGESRDYDRVLPRTSHEVAKYKEKSNDSWREKLSIGSLIDCQDNSGQWHNSTVVDSKVLSENDYQWVELKVGFRSYEPFGEKSDEKGNYRGWSVSFDEWVPVKSPRIAPLGMNGRKWSIPRENFNEEDLINDCNDILETSPQSFCVTRCKKSSSRVLLTILNSFGKADGFNFMLKVLQDLNNWPSFDVIYSFVVFVGKVYALLHKRFAMNFIVPFKNAVFNVLLSASTSSYREYSKEKLEQIFEHLESLLKRVFTIQQKNKIIDEFILEFSLKNLETRYLEKRIYGIKWISDAAHKSNSGRLRGMKVSELAKWVKEKKVLEIVYNEDCHDQIVQRSGEILKLLANDNSLSHSDIDNIWAVSQKNEDLRKVVYHVLIECNTTMKPEIISHIVQKVSELPPSKFLVEEITLIYELTKLTTRSGEANVKACEFFHHVVLGSDEYTDSCKNQSLEAYCNILKSWEKAKARPGVIESCVENIRKNSNSLYAIKMILKILTTFPVAYCTKDIPTRNMIAQKMINEQNVIPALFENIQHLKNRPNKESNYSDEISERLNFLKVLITESYTLKITDKQLFSLWDILYQDAGETESKIFIKWLKEATESQVNGKKIFEDLDIRKFFTLKIGSLESPVAKYSTEEFAVFKNCFLCINLSKHKITRLYSSLNQTTSDITQEFDYSIGVPPLDLDGMPCLRKIILEAESEQVFSISSDLLFEIYNHVTLAGIKPIRKELLDFFLNVLRQSDFFQKKRALEILKRFSEECEKNGTSRLSPHCALLKGEILTITIINSISYMGTFANDVPKKFEIKVFSNTTVWQLRNLIGKKIKCLYDQFRIYRSTFNNLEILDRENGKTLYSLRLRPCENLTLYKRGITRPKVQLLTSDCKLVPQAEKIFRKWFFLFADKGDKMSSEGASEFTNSCTGENCKGTDKKMIDFIANYDTDNDGLLTVENFLEFYRSSCITKPHAVWSNLNYHNYRNDLLGYEDDIEPTIDYDSLPSTLLSEDSENFSLIFDHLADEQVASQTWDLLCKLPTSPEILALVSRITEDSDWKAILSDDFSYKLLYVVQVIQSFLQDPSDEEGEKFEDKRKWKICFIRSGGVRVLLDKLLSLQGNLNTCQKICLDSVVKIVSVFILAAFAIPDIFEAVQLVRKESETLELFDEENGEKQKKEKEKEKINKAFNTLSEDINKESLSLFLQDSINFTSLLDNLLNLMFGIIKTEVLEPEDKSILDSALELWISCTLHRNDLLSCLYNFSQSFYDFLTLSLTKPKVEGIRKSFSQAYLTICKKVIYLGKSPVPVFLQTLLRSIQDPSVFNDSSQLYEFLVNLVEIDRLSPTQDYLTLGKFFIRQIFDIPYKESKSKAQADPVLVGVLKLANKIFESFLEYRAEVVTSDLINNIFTEILFPPQTETYEQVYTQENLVIENQFRPPKAKYRDSRKAAYNLLMTLTACEEKWSKQIIDHLVNLKTRVKPVDVWGYSPMSQIRSIHGYAGITNFGCICYMNSVLQQFFMIPQFRYSILEADDNLPVNLSEAPEWFIKKNMTEKLLDNNLLHQLQHLYGFLELTDRQSYKPAGFCFAYKDYSGEPVNTSIQQDAQEFINFFLERLDNSLSQTAYKNLVSNTFKGKLSNQIICTECRNVSETCEDFFNISLDVKHSKNLHESFTKFINGDTITGYNCESCKNKVDIKKRSLLHTLPNYLIVHLQRMVFNFDTMENEKINTRLEFPMDFNVYPYTTEGFEGENPTPDYLYDLKGVIVHVGTAQVGHYYSFIRDPSSPKRWFEFNDTQIKSFNPQQIESQCFGANSESDSFMKIERESSPNAYMLVYEKRVSKRPIEIILGSDSTTIARRDFEEIHQTVPTSVFQQVLKDNSEFLFEKNIYSFDFFEFLLSSFRNARYLFDVSSVIIEYMFDVVSHASNNKSVPDMVDVLTECLNIYEGCEKTLFEVLLEDSGERIVKYLLRCSDQHIRLSTANLIISLLKKTYKNDFTETGYAKKVVNLLLGLIPVEINKYSSKFEQYWYLFSQITLIEEFNLYLLDKGAMTAFIDFYLGSDSPLAKGADGQSGKNSWNTNFRYLVMTVYNFHLFIKKSDYNFTENDQKCITHPEFFSRSIKKNYDEKSINFLVTFWATSDYLFSQKISELLLTGLSDLEVEEQENFYKTISCFLSINDELADQRIQWLFGVPCPIVSNKTFSTEFCAAAITVIDDDVFAYPSYLNFTAFDTKQSISSFVWSQKKRWDNVCIISLNWVLEICGNNLKVLDYLQALPPPTYQYLNYYHWICCHIKNYKAANSAKRDLVYASCQSHLEKLGPVISTYNYIIADSVGSTELIRYSNESITVKQITHRCLSTLSRPNGKTNDAIPHLKLYIDKDKDLPIQNSKDFKENDCAVIISIANSSKDTKQVWFKFTSELRNSFAPLNGFSIKVLGESEKNVISLVKINPDLDWELIDFEIREEKTVETVKKVLVDSYTDNLDFFGIDEMPISCDLDDFGTAPSGLISCTVCTYFNEASNLKCSMCDSALNKR